MRTRYLCVPSHRVERMLNQSHFGDEIGHLHQESTRVARRNNGPLFVAENVKTSSIGR